MFQRNISPTSSGSKGKPSNKPAEAGSKLSSLDLLSFFYNPEDGSDMFLQNIGLWCYNPQYRTLHSHQRENFTSNKERSVFSKISVGDRID
jgi:hypothetical protein